MEDLISYPRGWEWLKTVPTEDFNWLIEILYTMTDDTDTYNFVTSSKNIQRKELADFINDKFGMEKGIITYAHYILCKILGIKSEDDYISALPRIREILGIDKKHPTPLNRKRIESIILEQYKTLDSLEQYLNDIKAQKVELIKSLELLIK